MSAVDKKQARRAFSRHRGGAEVFAEIGERLASRLDETGAEPSLIIDAGGNGAQMRARYPSAQVLAADFAAERLAKARGVWQACADIESLPVQSGAADMWWSNMCLEWTDADKALSEAARALRPQSGLLVFSTSGRDTFREARAVFAEGGRVHDFWDMHDLGDLLARRGFSEPVLETEYITLTYRSASDFFADIRAAGCACALQDRQRGMLGKDRWRAALEEYESRFSRDGKIFATLEIIYAVSWRQAERTQDRPVHFVRG